MPESFSPLTESLPFAVARRIDQLCDRFENAWKEGRPPRLEDFVADTPEPARTLLLRELLGLELAYRRRRAEAPTLEEYRQRFPADEPLLRELFGAPVPSSQEGDRTPESSPGAGAPKTSAAEAPGHRTGAYAADGSSDQQTLPGPEAAAGELAAGMVLGDYELLEKIGGGGMGLVFRARQRKANRLVALKVIRPELVETLTAAKYRQWLARFQREAQLAARLAHDAIVTVYEVGEYAGRPFYSMRHIAGQSLAQVIREGPLPDRRAAAYLEQVARAVDHAHGRGILHRDLKPGNILVDADDRPFVTDFGLAKGLEGSASLTDTGACLGSPPFMSPEQIEDSSRVTAASDVYSLGATLYCLLTGRPPFQAARAAETLNQVLTRDPVPPRELNPAIPRDLEKITLKCLRKEPHRRYRTARELADDLRRFLAGEPVRARPVGPAERWRRWCRRNPLAASLAAGVVVLFLGFWTATVLGYWKVAVARKELQEQRAQAQETRRAALLDQAVAHRLSQEGGRRWAALDALRRAAAIRPGPDLRTEYLRCLELADLRLLDDREVPGDLPSRPGALPLPPIPAGDGPRPGFLGEIVPGAGPGRFRLITPQGPVEIGPHGEQAGAKLAGAATLREPAVLSPNGRFFAAALAEGDGSQLWDLNSGEALGALADEAGRKPVPHLIAFNAASDGLAAAFRKDPARPHFSIRTYRLGPTGPQAGATWELDAVGLDCLCFAPSGELLAAGMAGPGGRLAEQYVIRRWDPAAEKEQEPLLLDGGPGGWNYDWRAPNRIAFGASGRLLVAARDHLKLWDLSGAAPREVWVQSLQPERAAGVSLSANGHWVITTEAGGHLKLWDAAAGGRLTLQARPTPGPAASAMDWTQADLSSLLVTGRSEGDPTAGARVWQLTRPVRLSSLFVPTQPPRGSPGHLALAFSPEERWLAYTDGANVREAPYLIDLQQPDAAPRALRGGLGRPGLLAFSPAGDQLWGIADRSQAVWRLPDLTGSGPQAVPNGQSHVVAAAFGRNGRVVGCLREKICLTVIDLATGKELCSSPATAGRAEFVAPPRFSPDGRHLLAATRTADDPATVTTQLWDCDQGTQATAALQTTGHHFFQGAVAMALTDGQALSLRPWAADRGSWADRDLPAAPPARPPLFRNLQRFARFSFSEDGRLCAETEPGGQIAVWECHGPRRDLRTVLTGRRPGSFSLGDLLAFSRDGARLAAFDGGHGLAVWSTQTGKMLGRLDLQARPELFAFAGDGEALLLVNLAGLVRSWKPGEQEARLLCRLESDPSLDQEKAKGWWDGALLLGADAVRLSADRRRLVYVSRPGDDGRYTVYVWDLPTGKLRTHRVPAQGRSWPLLGLSSDGGRLAVLETWAEVMAAQADPPADLVSLDRKDWLVIENREAIRQRLGEVFHLSPDGGYAAYGEDRPAGAAVRVVRLADRTAMFAKTTSEPVTCLALAAEARSLALGHANGRISLYHPGTQGTATNLDGDGVAVSGLAFDQTATLLASVSGRGETLTLWNPLTGEKLVSLATGFDDAGRVAVSPGGRWLAVLDRKGRLRLWDLLTVRARLREARLDWQ